MTISNKDNPLQVGDTIQIDGKEVTITCAVSDGVYSSEYSVICSPETFEWLTGETNYSLVGIQLDADADDKTVRQINNLVIGTVEADKLADVSGMALDHKLPLEERLARFLARAVNPYCFCVGGVGVKVEFSDDGPSLQDKLTDLLVRQKSGL